MKLMDILACPICKHYPLDLKVFDSDTEIKDGIISCSSCGRWYPIIDSIPQMLPDDRRDENSDVQFLLKWKDGIPKDILSAGKPFHP